MSKEDLIGTSFDSLSQNKMKNIQGQNDNHQANSIFLTLSCSAVMTDCTHA